MLIDKKCKNCGKVFKTIDKFPDEVCESCFDDYIKSKEEINKEAMFDSDQRHSVI